MKRNKTVKGLVILLSIMTLSSGLFSMTSFAGSNDTIIGNASFAEEIDTDIWSNPEGDITIKSGKLIIPSDGTEETRLITVAAAQENERCTELFQASTTLKITALPKGETFAFAFGLQTVEAYQGNKGNVEVAFTNDGGLKVAVVAYGDGGKANTIVKPTKCGSMNSNIKIEATLMKGGVLTLKVGGKTLCNKVKLPISGAGRLGFIQTGSCGAEVSNVKFAIRKYDAPQNCNIEENFDNGYMNTAVFSSKTIWSSDWYPQSLSVQEYKGNNVLMFERTYLAYIGTKYQYSNFEMTFDVPYMYRKDVRDENGEVIQPATANLVLSFGGDSVDHENYGYTQAAEAIVFHPSSLVSDLRSNHTGRDDNHLIFSPECETDKGFSVKLSVIDAVVTVGLKWLEEDNYSTVLTYTRENGTPTGYIHLWTNVLGNLAVDNIKIVNKDVKPDVITVEPTHDSYDRVADFNYQKEEYQFLEDVKEADKADAKEKDAPDWMLLVYATAAGALVLAVGFAIGEIRKKKISKQMGGKQDEA